MSDAKKGAAGIPWHEIAQNWMKKTPDHLVYLDTALRVVEASESFRELTGTGKKVRFTETLDPFTIPLAERFFKGLGENGDAEVLLMHHAHPEQSTPLEYSWVACRDEEGKCTGFWGVGRPQSPVADEEEMAELLEKLARLEGDRDRRRQEVVRLKRRLEDQSSIDDLTGLGNRRYIMDRLETEIPRAIRYDEPMTVVLFDIDHFSRVNEDFGQAKGDDVLREVARVVREQVRTTDLVARFDGEEFMVLCPHTDRASAQFLAERLRRRIAEMSFEGESGGESEEFGVTISTGLVTVAAGNEFDTEAILHAAEEALQAAKNGGMNRVQLVEAP